QRQPSSLLDTHSRLTPRTLQAKNNTRAGRGLTTQQLTQRQPRRGKPGRCSETSQRGRNAVFSTQHPSLVVIVMSQQPDAATHEYLCIPIEMQVGCCGLPITELEVGIEARERQFLGRGSSSACVLRNHRMPRDAAEQRRNHEQREGASGG